MLEEIIAISGPICRDMYHWLSHALKEKSKKMEALAHHHEISAKAGRISRASHFQMSQGAATTEVGHALCWEQ